MANRKHPDKIRSEKQTLIWTKHFKQAVDSAAWDSKLSINQWVIDVLSAELNRLEKI